VALDLFVVDQHLGALLDATLAGTGLTASLYAVYSQLAQGQRTPSSSVRLSASARRLSPVISPR
jgi:hypothetical protein